MVLSLIVAVPATAVAQSPRFPDVPADHYAFEAIEWAAEVGVTTGYTDGTFRPERPLIKRHAVVFTERYYDEILQAEESPDFTRGDMMVLLKAINDGTLRGSGSGTGSGSSSEEEASERFPDVPADHYAFEAVEWAAEVGVTTGYTDGTFKPERPLIKRHAVVFTERYFDEILQAEESEDFTRGDMMVILKAINDGTLDDPEPEVEVVYIGQWVPPEAGMVPVPFPECSDDPATWDENCTPPPNWDAGQFRFDYRSDATPRQTPIVVEFTNNCLSWGVVSCEWLLSIMAWPLNYLGAHPSCVDYEYSERLRAAIRDRNNIVGAIQDTHGWHNCVTVIDPLVRQPPDGRVNDIGYRLSDTGISMADRCRAVLPEDVALETNWGVTLTDGTEQPPVRYAPGHAGCDDWAAWVELVVAHPTIAPYANCRRSFALAQEWMEHHHGVHERYFTAFC